MSSLDDEIQRLVSMSTSLKKQASQMEVCSTCQDVLDYCPGVSIVGTCEYCGMQLLTDNHVIREHFFGLNSLYYQWEIHTPELCKSIRNGAMSSSPY